MEFTLYSFHLEPNYNFKVSHLVYKEIMECVNKEVFTTSKLSDIDKGWMFDINVSTGKEVEDFLVVNQTPTIDRKNKFYNYFIYLPNKYIDSNKLYPLDKFLDYVFDGLIILLKSFEIEDSVLFQCRDKLKTVIISNPDKYKYTGQEIDISDEEITALLGFDPNTNSADDKE